MKGLMQQPKSIKLLGIEAGLLASAEPEQVASSLLMLSAVQSLFA